MIKFINAKPTLAKGISTRSKVVTPVEVPFRLAEKITFGDIPITSNTKIEYKLNVVADTVAWNDVVYSTNGFIERNSTAGSYSFFYNGSAVSRDIVIDWTTGPHILTIDNNKVYLDDELKAEATEAERTTDNSFYINGTSTLVDFYYLKIYEAGELTHNIVARERTTPMYLIREVYDTVTNKVYWSNYTILVKPTTTNYISITDVLSLPHSITSKTEVLMAFRRTGQASGWDNNLLSSKEASTKFLLQFQSSTITLNPYWNGSQATNIDVVNNTIYTLQFGNAGLSYSKDNATRLWTYADWTLPESDNAIYINGGSTHSPIDLFDIYIIEDRQLVAHYVPMADVDGNGNAGLKDMLSNTVVVGGTYTAAESE